MKENNQTAQTLAACLDSLSTRRREEGRDYVIWVLFCGNENILPLFLSVTTHSGETLANPVGVGDTNKPICRKSSVRIRV